MKNLNVLVVDDEEKARRILEINLQGKYNLQFAENGEAALHFLGTSQIDLVITDLKMPGLDGQAILRETRERSETIPVIVMTAYGSIDNAVSLMKDGAFDYLTKPIDLERLELILSRAQTYVNLVRENERLRLQLRTMEGITNVITGNASMQAVLELVQRIAPTNFTVLIEGETGVGKDLIAKAIHSMSGRTSNPFIAVNCGAIPRELLESELFGSERGAFTGATSRHIGLFEQANGGTIFLDEIGELSVELQVKLLRTLEDQSIVRVGGNERIALDTRIVAATNKKLREEVLAGRFRRDLYYRLNVVNIVVPPLRERPEDIALLAQHFLHKHSEHIGKEFKGFDANALTYLRSYHWPGNVRELENTIVRAMVAGRETYINVEDLPDDLHLYVSGAESSFPSSYRQFLLVKKKVRERQSRDLERAFLLDALKKNCWNVSQTAKAIDMDRRQLQNMMKSLGLRTEEKEETS